MFRPAAEEIAARQVSEIGIACKVHSEPEMECRRFAFQNLLII